MGIAESFPEAVGDRGVMHDSVAALVACIVPNALL